MRSPFNWVGNKYRYVENINNITKDNKYNKVYDVFMGSGNILLNLECEAEFLIGNDSVPLIPNVYTAISTTKENFTLNELQSIVDKWNKFSDKQDYYSFRDYWNVKYLGNNHDKDFIYETILLLKMCSNSMVRFNGKKGYFNQGFRGLGKGKTEFFADTMKSKIIRELNNLKNSLTARKYEFTTGDFKHTLSKVVKDDLVILDPPYILSSGMYGMDFTNEDDLYLLDFLQNTDCHYMLFNYLESGEETNYNLTNFLSKNPNLYVENLNNNTSTGQNRKGKKEIIEIVVSNIGGEK